MKKILLTLLCCFPILAWGDNYRFEKTKTVSKAIITSTNNSSLSVTNKSGNITISSWDKNEISIKVDIKSKSQTEATAQKILDLITIQIATLGNDTKATTVLDQKQLSEIQNMRKTKSGSYEIHYTIMTPRHTKFVINNKYGNTKLDKTSQPFTADIKYGNLTISELLAIGDIEIKYGNLEINQAQDLDLKIKYGDYKIGKVANLKFDSGYANCTIGQAVSIQGESKYDKIKITSTESLNVSSSYSSINIGALTKAAKISAKYNQISISNITSAVSDINIRVEYADVTLGLSQQAALNVDLKSDYGKVVLPKYSVSNINKYKNNNKNALTGSIGSNPKGNMVISNKYGDIIISNTK